MILYCAALPIFLCCSIVHKITRHNNEKVILLVDKTMYEKRDYVNTTYELEKNKIFTHVFFQPLFIRKNLPKAEIKKNCLEQFDKVFADIGYNISDFDKIYVMNDNWDGDINLYFNLKKIHYTWIETVKNNLCEKESFQFTQDYNELVDEYRSLSPFAPYAHAEILEESIYSKDLLCECEYSTWNFQEEIKKLPTKDFSKVVECFNINENTITTNGSLLVVNSFGYACNCPGGLSKISQELQLELGVKDYDNDELFSVIDSTAIDYYATESDMIYLKSHPHDPISSNKLYNLYGPKWKLLPNAPFEFIQKYLQENNIHFNTVVGYASTSLNLLNKDFCNKLFLLGNDYFRTWYYYESIYITLMFAKKQQYSMVYTHPYICTQMKHLAQTTEFGDFFVEFNDFSNLRKILEIKNAIIVLDGQSVDINSMKFIKDVHESNIVCFLNINCEQQFFDDDLMYGFVPIKVQKTNYIEKPINIHKNEVIWVFSKKSKIRRDARNFQHKRDMPHTGIHIEIKKISLAECHESFRECKLRLIKKDFIRLKKTYEQWTSAHNCLDNNTELLTSLLRKENDVEMYFELLKLIKSNFMIILSVKDTPGSLISEVLISKLYDIGFSSFSSSLWRMYIGIVYKNTVVYDVVSDKAEESVLYKGMLNDLSLKISSKSWRNGNISEISINGIDYSTNSRGINIVVYDVDNKKIIDSIGFDSHNDISVFIHNKL